MLQLSSVWMVGLRFDSFIPQAKTSMTSRKATILPLETVGYWGFRLYALTVLVFVVKRGDSIEKLLCWPKYEKEIMLLYFI